MKNKYLKENFEPIVLNSKNLTEVLIKLKMTTKGNSRETLKKYIREYNINISHFETISERNKINGKFKKISLKNILIENSSYKTTSHLKNRLYDEGLKERKCEICGQNENWHGKHMSLIIDHINGINNDNRIENLRIVCPNCNATLPTHCMGFKKLSNKNKKKIIKSNNKINYLKNLSHSQRKVERPSKEQLQNEIKTIGYCATGRKYGVSDNSIRKWMKYYDKQYVKEPY
jgi:hypothetical protein